MDKYNKDLFIPLSLEAFFTHNKDKLSDCDCTKKAQSFKDKMLTGKQILWGMPFELGQNGQNNLILVSKEKYILKFPSPIKCKYLVMLHASDFTSPDIGEYGIEHHLKGNPPYGQKVADYTFKYNDGNEKSMPIRKRLEINELNLIWGENGYLCVPHKKAVAYKTNSECIEQGKPSNRMWGYSMHRVDAVGRRTGPNNKSVITYWLHAIKNPNPDKEITEFIINPDECPLFLFGITAAFVDDHPLRWDKRSKALITLDSITDIDELEIDMGSLISATPQLNYDNNSWESGYNLKLPEMIANKAVIEYTAHPNAQLYVKDKAIPLLQYSNTPLEEMSSCNKKVNLRVIDRYSGKTTPVRIHIHGHHGEYIQPINRHRIPSKYWFEDYAPEFVYEHHNSTYINGTAEYMMPLSRIYIEIAKGFEVMPIRTTYDITSDTKEIVIEIEKVLHWREKGWVVADTHVHFLSPRTAILEGKAEGVNVVNLLASQWGEIFTNIGDFNGNPLVEDDKDKDYFVCIGTENRQHVMGHISLLGYEGDMILPLCTGGPEESALGDPVECTLTEWARKCKKQNGITIISHIRNPRAENAATIVLGEGDALEIIHRNYPYGGLCPYALSEWYRYLNCGYHLPIVGGTDKMSASTAIGIVRTYAKLLKNNLSLDAWKQAVLTGNTFVTYGPLIEFSVEGLSAGSSIDLQKGGGKLNIEWEIGSVTVPVTSVELVANGKVIAQENISHILKNNKGNFAVDIKFPSWLAFRVIGKMPDSEEKIMAHSSAVMITIDNSRCFDSTDAMSILKQIEGVQAYIDTIGTRAEPTEYNKVVSTLAAAHIKLQDMINKRTLLY